MACSWGPRLNIHRNSDGWSQNINHMLLLAQYSLVASNICLLLYVSRRILARTRRTFKTRVGDNSGCFFLRSLIVCCSSDIRFNFLSKAINNVHLLSFFIFFEKIDFFGKFGFLENFGFFF